jgi:hypothetical protein
MSKRMQNYIHEEILPPKEQEGFAEDQKDTRKKYCHQKQYYKN